MSRRKRLLKKALEPRLEEAQNGTRAVFFVDAAHFVLTAYLGFLWCFVRQFIRAPAGRQRFNVLGALNAVTPELIMVTAYRMILEIEGQRSGGKRPGEGAQKPSEPAQQHAKL